MSLTRGHSCIICQQRKVRCDQQKPCTNCIRARVECKVAPPQPARRQRKKKIHERDLLERLRKYEKLMTRNGISFDSISDDQGEEERQGSTGSSVRPSTENNIPNQATRVEGNGRRKLKWFAYYDEYRSTEDLLDVSTDEEQDRPTIHHAFDRMFNDFDTFPLMVGGAPNPITHFHPSAIQIFQLWQVYLNNVNPLLKVFHAPTLQAQIVGAGVDLNKIPKPLEALLFGTYLIAVKSMTEEEVQTTLGESKSVILDRYHLASQQALVNAGFMRTNDLMVLQAFLLYLLSIGGHVDPRSLFCLIGIAVRIATRLGLHRDGARVGISPFEAELRRRTWWQLVILDKRIAEMTGSPITALSSCGSDCRLPLNVNDSDLHPDSKDSPPPSTGFTEMSFALSRIEFTLASAPDSIRPIPLNSQGIQTPREPPAKSTHSTPSFYHRPPHDIKSYGSHFETTYLKHCNNGTPIQRFTMLATKVGICKLHVVEFMCRGVPASNLGKEERDELFIKAIEMLEYDDKIHTSESLQGYYWYTQLQVPLPGFIFLASELAHRTSGELCERAWQTICDDHEHRGLSRNLESPMHMAFGHALLKAWNAREQAEQRKGVRSEPPKLIAILRQTLLSQKKGKMPEDVNQNMGTSTTPLDVYEVMEPSINTDTPFESERTFNMQQLASNEGTAFPTMPSAGNAGLQIGSSWFDSDQTDWAYLIQSGALGGLFGCDGPGFS